VAHDPGGDSPAARPDARPDPRERRLRELTFLEEVARLAASARTWGELLQTVVDGVRDAAEAEVCSLYLVDRDGSGITLAATNGIDHHMIGVAHLPMGVGITGLAAADRRPVRSPDVHEDPRFAWLPGVDHERFRSMCAVPLLWGDQVVGVLNIKTIRRRSFPRREVHFLESVAALLAGVVEKGRMAREARAQIESLQAIDEARASLVTMVTHDLRTPLAVVRAYLELLGKAAEATGDPEASDWETAALEQVDRLDQTVDSILSSLRAFPSGPPDIGPLDVTEVVDASLRELAPLFRRRHLAATFTERPLRATASAELIRRLLGYLLENAAKYAPEGGRIDVYGWRQGDRAYLAVTDDGPGVPPDWWERIFEPFVRLDDSPRGSGIGLFAARRLARSIGGDLRVEGRQPKGSQFILELAGAP
jgi:signal transduction histidine kinase